MSLVKRTIKIITCQEILHDRPREQQKYPYRKWSIEVVCINKNGEEVPASFIDKVTYKLHPTFPNPNKVFRKPPFRVEEIGWGEFDMEILIHFVDKGGEASLRHDLNFSLERYEVKHTLSLNMARSGIAKALAELDGNTDVDENAKRKRKGDLDFFSKKRSKSKIVDLEKLADGLQKLDEDTLIQIVQMIDENKTPEMYIKNDIEGGEFHVDLFTLPDTLLVSLWNLTSNKLGLL